MRQLVFEPVGAHNDLFLLAYGKYFFHRFTSGGKALRSEVARKKHLPKA